MKNLILILTTVIIITSNLSAKNAPIDDRCKETPSESAKFKANVCVNAVFVSMCFDIDCYSFKGMLHKEFGCYVGIIRNSSEPGIHTIGQLADFIETQRGLPKGTLTEIEIASSSEYEAEDGKLYRVEAKSYPIKTHGKENNARNNAFLEINMIPVVE